MTNSRHKNPHAMIACDLDDTLAVTKSPIAPEMAAILEGLLDCTDICVITGGKFDQIRRNVIDQLSDNTDRLKRLYCISVSGAELRTYDGEDWRQVYSLLMSEAERARIRLVVESAAKSMNLWEPKPDGDILQDRLSQITFSALGQAASPTRKRMWDKDMSKRTAFRDELSTLLPEYDIAINGNTSLDIVQRGVNKAYGIEQLLSHRGLRKEQVIFFGDSLFPGGNDWPVSQYGIESVAVSSWTDTLGHLSALLNELKSTRGEARERGAE